MTISEIKERLKDNGIEFDLMTLRRRIDTYISYPTRNQKNNRRDITQEEFKTLLLSLALEIKGIDKKDIENYLNGKSPKSELMNLIVDSNKVDEIIKRWIEE